MSSRPKIVGMIHDLEAMEHELLPESYKRLKAHEEGMEHMDDFGKCSHELQLLINSIDTGISNWNLEMAANGRSELGIKQKAANSRMIDQAKAKHIELGKIVVGIRRKPKTKKYSYEEEQIDSMEQLVNLLGEKIQGLDNAFNNRGKEAGLTFARELLKLQRAQHDNDDDGKDDHHPHGVPNASLSVEAQEFLERRRKDDEVFEDKLSKIEKGIRGLHHIALVMNDELKAQEGHLEELEDHMDEANRKIKVANRQVKKLTEDKGMSGTHICVLVMLVVILLALLGYIYNVSV